MSWINKNTITKGHKMKNKANGLLKSMMMATVVMGVQVLYAEVPQQEYLAKLKLAQDAYNTGILAEKISKDYLYLGNKVGVRQAKDEVKKAKQMFSKKFKILNESINDPKSKNLLVFMGMSMEELEGLLDQPYSLDDAHVALDLSQTILEGSRFIADRLKKSIGYSSKYYANGICAYFESIPKYYMAYQAGIKDENTVSLMKETVKLAGEAIEGLSNDPKNTVAMNQKISKIKRLWSVVYKFYLDIDKGGLPFIVYKTSLDLNKNLVSYLKMAEETRKTGLTGSPKSSK